jgi:hypothetical protein
MRPWSVFVVLLRHLGHELLALFPGERLVRDEERRGRLHLRAGRRKQVRHGKGAALGEAAVVVALAARDLLHGRDDEERVGAAAGGRLDRREPPLRRRREENAFALEHRPVAVGPRRGLRIEHDAGVLSERRVLEVGPDLELAERVGATHRHAGVRRSGGDEYRRPVVVQAPEELDRFRAAGRLRRGGLRIHGHERGHRHGRGCG